MDRRGVSVVVSTLLLVLLTVSIAAGVSFWIRGTVLKAQKEGDATQACSNIEFTAADFCKSIQTVFDVTTGTSKVGGTQLRFDLRNDAQNQEIYGFLVSLIDKGGNTRTISTLPYSNVIGADTKQLVTGLINNTDNIDQVAFIPEVNVSSSIVPCKNQEKDVNWGNIHSC